MWNLQLRRFSIRSTLGVPMEIYAAKAALTRLSIAWLCVLKKFSNIILIGSGAMVFGKRLNMKKFLNIVSNVLSNVLIKMNVNWLVIEEICTWKMIITRGL